MRREENHLNDTGDEYARLSAEDKAKLAKLVALDNLEETNRNQSCVLFRESFYTKYGKRLIDIIISSIALIITLPINIIIAVITIIDVGLPLFFVQERVGKEGRIFKLLKFRNMTNETDDKGVLLPTSERVTKWGRFVRKTSLDELLNFWNILKGDMSLIGPRPLPIDYVHFFSERHKQRHLVSVGLDCPMHNGAPRTWQNRLENDVWYVENISIKTDVYLIVCLIKETFAGKEKEQRGSGDGGYGAFVGYDAEGMAMDSHNIPRCYFNSIRNLG